MLRGYQYDGVSFREIPPVTIAPMGKDAGLYKKLFEEGQGPRVQEYPWQQVQQMAQALPAAAPTGSEAGRTVARPGEEGKVNPNSHAIVPSAHAGHSMGELLFFLGALAIAGSIIGLSMKNIKSTKGG